MRGTVRRVVIFVILFFCIKVEATIPQWRCFVSVIMTYTELAFPMSSHVASMDSLSDLLLEHHLNLVLIDSSGCTWRAYQKFLSYEYW